MIYQRSIHIRLTDEEYNSLQKLSEVLKTPASTVARNILSSQQQSYLEHLRQVQVSHE